MQSELLPGQVWREANTAMAVAIVRKGHNSDWFVMVGVWVSGQFVARETGLFPQTVRYLHETYPVLVSDVSAIGPDKPHAVAAKEPQ